MRKKPVKYRDLNSYVGHAKGIDLAFTISGKIYTKDSQGNVRRIKAEALTQT